MEIESGQEITIQETLAPLQQERDLILPDYGALLVNNDADMAVATQAVVKLHLFTKRAEGLRKDMTAPLNERVKWINGQFAMLTDPIGQLERTINSKVFAYRQVVEAARRKEQARQDALAEKRQERAEAKGITPPIPEIVAPIVAGPEKRIETDFGKASFTEKWNFTITDETLIPREYLMVDEVKIRKVVKALKADTKIPGIRVFDEGGVSIRGNAGI
jgi:hypothetical protein